MSKIGNWISKQWLVYLGCFILFFLYSIITNNDPEFPIYAKFFVSIIFSIILYIISIPIQITIWSIRKNNFIMYLIRGIFSYFNKIEYIEPKN